MFFAILNQQWNRHTSPSGHIIKSSGGDETGTAWLCYVWYAILSRDMSSLGKGAHDRGNQQLSKHLSNQTLQNFLEMLNLLEHLHAQTEFLQQN